MNSQPRTTDRDPGENPPVTDWPNAGVFGGAGEQAIVTESYRAGPAQLFAGGFPMPDLTVSRKHRLEKLEGEIHEAATEIKQNRRLIAVKLCEVRDDHLWKGEYPSFDSYMKAKVRELLDVSYSQATRLIRTHEVARRIPPELSSIGGTELGSTHLDELARLAPNVGRGDGRGVQKDFSELRPQTLARVLMRAIEAAGGGPVGREGHRLP
jgi:hypothetical protein